MHVPDVMDVNGGRMNAQPFLCLTEDLISLFGAFGKEGRQEILKRRDVGGNDNDYSFDLYLSRFAELRPPDPPGPPIWVTHQLVESCWERDALHKGTLNITIKRTCRLRTTPWGVIWFHLHFKRDQYSAQRSFLSPQRYGVWSHLFPLRKASVWVRREHTENPHSGTSSLETIFLIAQNKFSL